MCPRPSSVESCDEEVALFYKICIELNLIEEEDVEDDAKYTYWPVANLVARDQPYTEDIEERTEKFDITHRILHYRKEGGVDV